MVIEFCFPNLTQSTANAVRLIRARTSRVTEIVPFGAGFRDAGWALGNRVNTITAQKLNVAYTHLRVLLSRDARWNSGCHFLAPGARFISPAACLVRNCLLVFAEDQRREARQTRRGG